MKLSIIIPVFNEEKTIGTVLKKVFQIHLGGVEKEIIIVDDGSSDATASEIQSAKAADKIQNLKIFRMAKNLGKGAAVRTGIKHATGDYILIQDADLEYRPSYIVTLLSPILNDKASVVYATRLNRLPHFDKEEKNIRFFIHYLGNRLLSLFTSLLYGQWITDMETGYKLFPKSAVQRMDLRAKSFDFEPEITAKLLKAGYHIYEIPIVTEPRGYEEGKKLNTFRDGMSALWTLLKYRMSD